ncbi:unnamed protein product [Ilex paraguariensis]|uniref:Uncharacterized protein n=1 Tax=Ilex paraguariensis TaxID=185542 RepID=A0ABC8QY99_9AQUA
MLPITLEESTVAWVQSKVTKEAVAKIQVLDLIEIEARACKMITSQASLIPLSQRSCGHELSGQVPPTEAYLKEDMDKKKAFLKQTIKERDDFIKNTVDAEARPSN